LIVSSFVKQSFPAAFQVAVCFASCIGSTNDLELGHHREVSSVSGEVMLSHQGDATSVCTITGQRSLSRNSDTRTVIDPPYG
jgi:hypothetical protein